MKTIGLLGGMSWESTAEYYRIINEEINRRMGDSHSASILMYSFDFQEIEDLQHQGAWDRMEIMLAEQARKLEQAGAALLLICTNTMHRLAPAIEKAIGIPLLHIADATGQAIVQKQIHTVGLLGTRFTMEGDFYRKRLDERFDLNVIVPTPEEREEIHRIIYGELVTGKIRTPSREKFIRVIGSLGKRGAEGIILGCTEIPLLVKQEHSPLPLFDTTTLHALAGVEMILK
ncbi:MAG TPA: aspartate/glutamate racemase family protein [Bacteroidetes bacterium]|nr:aspartate/glutamate racemase family protein [Bacteroidota bacterium]